jgi:NAD(P)-dependent dehydrogenase (short-subunit alcohol dehydrogenase family)
MSGRGGMALNGAVVVITGASSGVGRAAALAYAKAGARVVVAARGTETLEDTAAACRRAGAEVLVVRTDVSDPVAVEQLAAAAEGRFGRIDVWANVAGIGAVGEFVGTPLAQHIQVIRTNLLGYLHGAHAALELFERQGRGVLININSVGAFAAAPYAVAYSASKFGVRGLSLALRGELSRSPGVRVCEIYGSFLDTPGIAHAANYSGGRLRPAPPVDDPVRVANIMVDLVRRPRGEVMVDAPARAIRAGARLLPRTASWSLGRFFETYRRFAEPAAPSAGTSFSPGDQPARIHGGFRSAPLRFAAGALLTMAIASSVYVGVRQRGSRR